MTLRRCIDGLRKNQRGGANEQLFVEEEEDIWPSIGILPKSQPSLGGLIEPNYTLVQHVK